MGSSFSCDTANNAFTVALQSLTYDYSVYQCHSGPAQFQTTIICIIIVRPKINAHTVILDNAHDK